MKFTAFLALALAVYGLAQAARTAGVDGSPVYVSYSIGVGARSAIGSGRGLCVARADGRASRRLTRKDDRNPSWAPGGRRVAFARYRRGGDSVSDILVADTEGRVIRKLSSGLTTESADPDWSPDGRSIAYVAAHRGSAIIVVDRRGNRRRIVESAPSGWSLGSPAWSPDGGRLAFAQRSPGSPLGLWIRPVDAGQAQLVAAQATEPDWSPDGKTLAFVDLSRGRGDVVVAELDGTVLRRITATPEPESRPAWSPDGKLIAFTRSARGKRWIVVAESGTGQPVGEIRPRNGLSALDAAWRPGPLPPTPRKPCR